MLLRIADTLPLCCNITGASHATSAFGQNCLVSLPPLKERRTPIHVLSICLPNFLKICTLSYDLNFPRIDFCNILCSFIYSRSLLFLTRLLESILRVRFFFFCNSNMVVWYISSILFHEYVKFDVNKRF